MNLNKLSAATQAAILAAVAATAEMYAPLAANIANRAAGLKATTDEAKSGLWGEFKRAFSIAAENGHDAAALRTGLESACLAAEVPSGTVRSYLPTIEKLWQDVDTGSLTLSEATSISIKDARKRYIVPPTDAEKAEKAARERLAEVTAGWDSVKLSALCDYIVSLTADTDADGDTVNPPQVANG